MSTDLMNIVALNPIKQKFFQRLDGNIDLGLSFVKGNNNLQFNYDVKVIYRVKKSKHEIHSDAVFSYSGNSKTVKQDASYGYTKFLKKDNFGYFAIKWQENTELGVQNRVLFFANVGVFPIRNNINILAFSGGFVSNTEQSQSDTLTTNLEANLKIGYDLFSFSEPDLIISITASPFLSLTDWGRFRMDSNVSVKWEVFNDFYLKSTAYYNLDTRPPTASASNYDFGLTFGISFTY
jgi:hypothetical protein